MRVRDPEYLVCREVVEFVSDFLSSAMAPDDHARLEQHLLVCPPCAEHVNQVRSTIAQLGTLRRYTPPAPARPALVELFRKWKQERDGDEGP